MTTLRGSGSIFRLYSDYMLLESGDKLVYTY